MAVGGMGSAHNLCDPGANPWIQQHLYDCVYTTRDIIGFSFGIASIGFWVVAQVTNSAHQFSPHTSEHTSGKR